ncbi:MAG TPA: adenylate/guanylate cyclase domain-containing protein [Acidimicrobiales bacterium]|nr:adenylate/guanylate cyclase domain-containing protein [Acidimicrobiales bacterium]
MEPAPELVAFVQKWLPSWFVDYEHFVDAIAHHPGTQFIGPDPDEWWQGSETILAVGKAQFIEMATLGAAHLDVEEIVAWKEGTVGWIFIRYRVALGDMEPRDARSTIIVHEEGAYWKVVHMQFAFTTSNEEAVGLELTTALDELLLLVQDASPPTTGMSADGSVTIVFTDLEGSTVLMESLGEDRWLELLEWHDSIVREKTAVFGGTVVKGQGDGFMLAFPAAGSAAACASVIQRTFADGWSGVPVPARIGLHTGNAKAEGGDFFGRTVVVAARISGAASGGEILVSQSTQQELGGAFALAVPRSVALKGLGGNFTVFEVMWRS